MFQPPAIKRRKRDPAFTTSEKMNLIDLVEKHYSVIECKRIDAVSNRNKINAWEKIAQEFNASTTYIEREVTVLRNLWDNLKKKAKVTMTMINESSYVTGGGLPKNLKDDPVIDIVISLIKNNVEGFQNLCNSDSQGGSSEIQVVNEDHNYDSQSYQVLTNGDWSSYTTALFRTNPLPEEPKPPVSTEEGLMEPVVAVEKIEEDTPNNSSETSIATNLDMKQKEIKRISMNKPIKATRLLTNRRWPLLKDSKIAAFAQSKINALKITTEHVQEEHKVTMRLLRIQEQQEIERLKQEKEKTEQEQIKTEILREQLRQLQDKTSQ